LDLIGDILDIARIESGRLTLNPERANPRELVESVVRVFDGLARQKSLSLALDLDSRINVDVLLDPQRFKQILSNLISNAIKFTEHGQIKISLQVLEQPSPQHVLLQLVVQDSGIGISLEDQQQLFEPFAQVDNSAQLARSGAGLGLVICRSLCEMMGGQLTLSSQPGQGTRVEMNLTLTTLEPLGHVTPRRELQPGTAPQTATSLNILIVDDHPANRLLMAQQLDFLGHRFQVAEHGAEALSLWLEGHFDLVLADCNMPVMNGYDLSRAIRAHEQAQAQRPCTIFGFTANAQPEEYQRCRDAGMNSCLFKPISLTALAEHLTKIPALPAQPTTATSALFSLDSVQALTGGRPDQTRRLLAQLLSSSQDDRKELTTLPVGNRQDLRNMAHKIKGAARIIQAGDVIEHCEALEDACDEEASNEVIAARLQAMETAMIDLETVLRAQLGNCGPETSLTPPLR
jgi:two-component system sensor histidine kinase EvgS